MLYGQSSPGIHEGENLGIIETAAAIVGFGSLVYLVYALLKPDRF